MPHDCKGRLVERGDVVKGTGYNIKHEIIGPVLKVVDAESCNVTVGVVCDTPVQADNAYGLHGFVNAGLVYHVMMEYGAAKDFEILRKYDGTFPDPMENVPAEPTAA